MHNLHYVIVEAGSGQEACETAISAIEHWGDENNWRVACGAVSATGEVYSSGEGRWDDPESLNLDNILETSKRWISVSDNHHAKTFQKVVEAVNLGKPVETIDWYIVKKYAEFKSDQGWALEGNKITPDQFDPFKHEFRAWNFAECGVTHNSDLSKVPTENQWCVLIDMHS